jgi:ribosome-associated protein
VKKKAKAPAKKTAKAQTLAKKPSAKKPQAKKKAAKKVASQSAKKARKPAPKRTDRIAAPPAPAKKAGPPSALLQRILTSLDDDKAENIVTIDLEGRSALCDAAVIASGRSSRHVSAMAEHLARRLKESGYGTRPINGQGQGDWVLVDAGDVIVHIFRPEVRDYYDLEGMWSVGRK